MTPAYRARYHSLACVYPGCLREDAVSVCCGDSGLTDIVFVPMTVRTGQP